MSQFLEWLKGQAPWLLPFAGPLVFVISAATPLPEQGYKSALGGEPDDAKFVFSELVGEVLRFLVAPQTFLITLAVVVVLIVAVAWRTHRTLSSNTSGHPPRVLKWSFIAAILIVVVACLATLPYLWAPTKVDGVLDRLKYSPGLFTVPGFQHIYDEVFSWYYGVNPDKGRVKLLPDQNEIGNLASRFRWLAAITVWISFLAAIALTLSVAFVPERWTLWARGHYLFVLSIITLCVLNSVQWLLVVENYGGMLRAERRLASLASSLEPREVWSFREDWPFSYIVIDEDRPESLCIRNMWPIQRADSTLELRVSVPIYSLELRPIALPESFRKEYACDSGITRGTGELLETADLVAPADMEEDPGRMKLRQEVLDQIKEGLGGLNPARLSLSVSLKSENDAEAPMRDFIIKVSDGDLNLNGGAPE